MIEIVTDWYCPNCGLEDRTLGLVANRFHVCARLHGLNAPLLRKGTDGKVEAHLREDYINGDNVRLDDAGRPVMNIITEREDGFDTMVFAPTATAKGDA